MKVIHYEMTHGNQCVDQCPSQMMSPKHQIPVKIGSYICSVCKFCVARDVDKQVVVCSHKRVITYVSSRIYKNNERLWNRTQHC